MDMQVATLVVLQCTSRLWLPTEIIMADTDMTDADTLVWASRQHSLCRSGQTRDGPILRRIKLGY